MQFRFSKYRLVLGTVFLSLVGTLAYTQTEVRIRELTEVTADGISSDGAVWFGVDKTDVPASRKISLAELKKTGVQVVNVLQYGADPTGVADSTAGIQAAIDAVESAGGGHVYLPGGSFAVSSTITIPTGVHIVGSGRESTFVELDGTNFNAFTASGTSNWSLKDLTIWTKSGETANGTGVKFTTGGNVQNAVVENVVFWLLLRGVETDHYVTHVEFRNCEWAYCTNESFYINTGSVVNMLMFNACRFEDTYSCHYKQHSAVTATTARFTNTVIESSRAQYAIDLGSHPYDVIFTGCHFENNALGSGVTDSADVRVINGAGSLSFVSCNFSTPSTETTGHYNIRGTSDPAASLTLVGNTFASAGAGNAADYTGVAYWRRSNKVVAIGNNYTYDNFDYYPQVETRVSFISERPRGSKSYATNDLVSHATTTDATATNIFNWDYLSLGGTMHSYLATADITGVSEDGTVYAGYRRGVLVIRNDTGGTNTLVGTIGDASQESEAGLDAAWSVSSDNEGTLSLKVTGKAATNIRWTAKVDVTVANY